MFVENLEEYLNLRGIPSCDVIAYKNHKEVFRHMSGYSDGQKKQRITGDEIYILYSASKVITCAAAMQLYERGIIGIDDPVSKYLPEFRNLTYKSGNGVLECKNTLTIRHLFTMTGGFNYDLRAKPIVEVRETSGGKATTLDIVNAIAKSPLEFEPGTRYNYSLCHDILGALIEVASGKKFGEYLKENIFEPLGMKDTTFSLSEEQKKRLVSQYVYENEGYRQVPSECVYKLSDNYESGGAGLYSTVNDYILFSDALANGGEGANGSKILEAKTIELMRTNQLSGITLKDFEQKASNKPGYGYAFGVYTMLDPKAAFGSVAPVGVFGWDGAAGSYTAIDPENNIAIFYAQQVLGHGWAYSEVHPTVRDSIYRKILGT